MLKFWLPYTKDGRMVGLSPTSATSYSSASIIDGSPIGGKCASGCKIFHTTTEEFGNAWTIATWVNNASWSPNNDIISCKNTSASTYCQWYFSVINAKTFNLGINGGSSTVSCSYNFSANTWYHVAATYDGENYAMYINGECVKSGAYSSAMKTGCTNVCVVCRSSNQQGTSPTAGGSKTSDFRIYDHALEAYEIKDLYNCKTFEMFGGLHVEGATNISNQGNCGGWNNSGTASRENNVTTIPNTPCKAANTVRITETTDGQCAITFGTSTQQVPSKTITASVYLYITGNITSVIQPYIRSTAKDNNLGNFEYEGNATFSTWPKDKWIRVTKTITTSSAETTVYFCAYTAKSGCSIAFNGWQIEERDHASPYALGSRDAWSTDMSCYKMASEPYNIVKSGTSVYFNGSNSYISIPGGNLTGGSVSMWVYVQTKQSVQRVLYFDPTSKMGIGFLASGRLCCAMNDTNTNSYNAANFVYGNWNHIVVVYGTNRQPSACYINGVSEAATTESTWWMYSGTNAAIGKRLAGGNADVLLGYIRDISVYAKQLSAEDAMNLYTHGQ